jgi:hypothetical protein
LIYSLKAIHMSSKNNHKTIELFGLPGTGKTTYLKSLDFDKKDFYISRFRFIEFIFLLFVIIVQTLKSKTYKLFRFKLSLLLNYYSKKNNIKGNVIYLDEGILQRILSIYEEKLSFETLDKIFKFIKISDEVLIIDFRYNLFNRYNHKDNVRLSIGDDYIDNWKDIIEFNFSLMTEYLQEKSIQHKILK